MRKSEEMELQRLSQQKRLTFGELQREKILWDKYFDDKEDFDKRNKS